MNPTISTYRHHTPKGTRILFALYDCFSTTPFSSTPLIFDFGCSATFSYRCEHFIPLHLVHFLPTWLPTGRFVTKILMGLYRSVIVSTLSISIVILRVPQCRAFLCTGSRQLRAIRQYRSTSPVDGDTNKWENMYTWVFVELSWVCIARMVQSCPIQSGQGN